MSERPSNEEIVAGIADALPLGIWVARAPGGEFVFANQTFQEIMGMAARPDVARGEYAEPYQIRGTDGELYPESSMPFVRALEARQTVMVDDIVIHRTDGRRVSIRAYARPLFDEAGEITHVVIAFLDISREVAAERAHAEVEARMRRAQRLESLGNLAGGIAHDFNNILGAIKIITDTLRIGEKDEQRLEDLATLDDAANSAVELTQAILGFAGRGKHLAVPVSLDRLVTRVHGIFAHGIDRRIEIVTDLGSTRHVIGDHVQLEQVVMNLVINARDAMSGGGRLILRSRDDGERVVLEVEDTGPGIPVELRDRVFEPYFTTKPADGSVGGGLGLATVYGIVESHGGSIDIEDAPGGGALFRVTLPSVPSTRSEIPPDRLEGGLIPGEGLILVVDDEPSLRQAAERALQAIGYRVLSAENGKEAVEIFREQHGEIDGVLLDWAMPVLDGRGAYIAMREIDPEVRVLLTTGYAFNEEVQALLDLGVDAFIAKPWSLEELSVAVAKLLA